MNIVSLLYNRIAIVSFKKQLLRKPQQYTAEVSIAPEETLNLDVDKLALSLKRAMAFVPENALRGKIKLILGQSYFHYQQIELPADLNDQALNGFIKEQLIRQVGNEIDNSLFHYVVSDFKGKKYAGVYLLTQTVLQKLTTLFSFYDLKIEEIYPEALLIFGLFENTLNKQKEEAALFLEYEEKLSTGLLFNSTGLLSEKPLVFPSQNLQKELKEFKKKQPIPVSRLILGGKLSTQIRQDNFTKESGIWTNPLEKVLQNSVLKTAAEKLKLMDKLLLFSREINLLHLLNTKQHLSLALSLKNFKFKTVVTAPEPITSTAEPITPAPKPITPVKTGFTVPVEEPEQKEVINEIKEQVAEEKSPPVPIKQPQEKPLPVQLPINPKPVRDFKPLFKVLLLVLLSALITYLVINFGRIGLNRLQNISLPKINLKKPTPTPTAKPTPKATPTPELTRAKIEIEILNGTGVAGMASSFQNELEDLGYTVNEIGNADNYDYEQTVIITNSQKAFNLLKKDLAEFKISQPKYEKTNNQITTIIFGTDLELP